MDVNLFATPSVTKLGFWSLTPIPASVHWGFAFIFSVSQHHLSPTPKLSQVTNCMPWKRLLECRLFSKTLRRQHFPLCPPSPARVVSTSSKGSLKMESHMQMKILRNPAPWKGEHLPREGGLCWSHLSGYVRRQGLRPRTRILCLLECCQRGHSTNHK